MGTGGSDTYDKREELLRFAVVSFSDILVAFWTLLESQFLHFVACFTP